MNAKEECLPLRSIRERCTDAEWKARVDLAACYLELAMATGAKLQAVPVGYRY